MYLKELRERFLELFKKKWYSIIPSASLMPENDFAVLLTTAGGPHVKRTGELGNFKIVKEEASSSGVRRIKAVLQ
jgi:alanyl-tRNA synthetase